MEKNDNNIQLAFLGGMKAGLEALIHGLEALQRKTGARGLRAIMEAVMLDLMYHVPSDDSIKECVVDADMVDGILHGNKDLEKLAS